ncbi:hypothetical protein [Aquimarina aquimarini]|uniref:hypothetical protein n=1 Tax=Aquimarina aquimarini TaxID=1191734 RepID=UPI00131ED5D0|nr:hypothetical protein [Aquimarina aquimarini]
MKMTKLLFSIAVIAFVSIHSYGQKVKIDYSVDYEIEKRGKKDTITIGFSKSGDYLYSDADLLGQGFKNSVFRRRNADFTNSELHTVFDIKNRFVCFLMSFDKNEFFMKMNIDDFIPPMNNKSSFDKITEFVLEKTDKQIEIENTSYDIHNFYFDSEPNEKIEIAYAKEIEFDNSVLMNSLYTMLTGKDGQSKIKTPIINGVILYIASKRKTLFKAIKIDTNPKTLDINFSYKITE